MSRRILQARAFAAGAVALLASLVAAPASGAEAQPAATVSPTNQLHDGQQVLVSVTRVPAHAALLALECSTRALTAGEDACENHRNELFFANGNGQASTRLDVTSKISTALGTVSCVTSTCVVGVVRFTSGTTESIVGFSVVTFSSTACRGGIRCQDAPTVPPTTVRSPPRGRPLETVPATISPGFPLSTEVSALPSGPLDRAAAVTGPYHPEAAAPAEPPSSSTIEGQGILQLSAEAPGTSWASARDKAVVVDARVDGGPWQQLVLFDGARAFTYAGFTGPLRGGEHHLAVRVDQRLSTTGNTVPKVRVLAARLLVVPPASPAYLLERYAPVVYGRATSASSDTQLLTYGTATPEGAGTTALSYETVWSHEDAGTSFVPFLEWGEWGRMTDITATVSLDVGPTGAISHPMYDWCGCQPGFRASRQSKAEVMVPFHGRFVDGTHMVVRNASGNDYQSDQGTTEFRFQQPAVPGPGPGQAREVVMDRSPWTYRIMNQEVRWWYLDRSDRARSGQPGPSTQYGIVDLDTTGEGVTSVAVDFRLQGLGWYSNDDGSGIPLYVTGHGRTAVKFPAPWLTHRITAVRLVVTPPSAASTLSVRSFRLLGLDPSFRIHQVPTPKPAVVGAPG